MWEEKSISDVAKIISGGTPKTAIMEYWDGDISWLSVKDFSGEKRKVYTSEKTITKEGLEKSAATLIYEGDIVISARGTVGELVQVGIPMTFNQSCFGLSAKKGYINDFIYYALKQYLWQKKRRLSLLQKCFMKHLLKRKRNYLLWAGTTTHSQRKRSKKKL